MKKINAFKVFLIPFFIVCFSVMKLSGQDVPEIYDPSKDSSFGMLQTYIVQVGNFKAPKITFSLSFDRSDWKSYSLYKYQNEWFDLRKKNQQNVHYRGYLRICTDNLFDCLTYTIEGRKRYRFYWNLTEKKWMLTQLNN